jgi:hypothetical protein
VARAAGGSGDYYLYLNDCYVVLLYAFSVSHSLSVFSVRLELRAHLTMFDARLYMCLRTCIYDAALRIICLCFSVANRGNVSAQAF